MLRWACLAIAMTACAGSPPAARLFPAGTGECPDASGCGVPVGEQPAYIPPDEAHGGAQASNIDPDKVPPATCADVGTNVASIELGNYASEEERVPIATKYRGRCRTLRLDLVERECVVEADDFVSVAYCAPRFVPQEVVAFVEVPTCAVIANEIRARSNPQPDAPKGQAIWERRLIAMQRSCEQDRWTVAFGECARTMAVANHIAAYCQHVAPAPLVARLQDRMAKVK